MRRSSTWRDRPRTSKAGSRCWPRRSRRPSPTSKSQPKRYRRDGAPMSGLNIADIFDTVVATVPDQPALVVRTCDGDDEVRFSFAELDARVNRLARALLAMGI